MRVATTPLIDLNDLNDLTDGTAMYQPDCPCLARRVRHALLPACLAVCGMASEAADTDWPVAGRQGLIRVVIVPQGVARDREAYKQQIARLCAPDQTCFLNFFTNSTGAPLEVPLADAIAREATAIYRHSVKQGAELFRFSCRLGGDPGDCF